MAVEQAERFELAPVPVVSAETGLTPRARLPEVGLADLTLSELDLDGSSWLLRRILNCRKGTGLLTSRTDRQVDAIRSGTRSSGTAFVLFYLSLSSFRLSVCWILGLREL